MEFKTLLPLGRGCRGLRTFRLTTSHITKNSVPTSARQYHLYRSRSASERLVPTSETSSRSFQWRRDHASAASGDRAAHRSFSSLSNPQSLHLATQRSKEIFIIAPRNIPQQARFLSRAISRPQQKDVGRPDASGTSPSATKTVPTVLTKLNPLAAKEQKENIYTIPNLLTFSRLIAAPAIGYAILTSHPHLALGLFAYAGFTDLIDGYLARRFNSQTVVGTIIDPMADKTLMTIVVVCLTVQGILPTWLAVIVLGRDVALAISAIYFRWISLPPPKTFARYWDFSLPSAEVHPTEISKINTFLQLLLVGNAMVLPTLPVAIVDVWNLYGVFEGWQYLVAGTTVWSGLSYVFSKNAVKILSEQEVKQKQREQSQKLPPQ